MIYFVRSRNTGHVKIGYTANIQQRLVELTSKYGKIDLLGVITGGRAFENALHRAFAEYRVVELGREWFRYNPSLRKYITTYATRPDAVRPMHPRPLTRPIYRSGVNCHLYELILKKRQQAGCEEYDLTALSADTHIPVGVLERMMRNQARTFKDAHCDTLLKFFRCDVGDLLTYMPDEQPA